MHRDNGCFSEKRAVLMWTESGMFANVHLELGLHTWPLDCKELKNYHPPTIKFMASDTANYDLYFLVFIEVFQFTCEIYSNMKIIFKVDCLYSVSNWFSHH